MSYVYGHDFFKVLVILGCGTDYDYVSALPPFLHYKTKESQ